MTALLFWIFDPHPLPASYSSPNVLGLGVVMAALLLASFALRLWRSRQQNAVLRKLSRSWSPACFWFGIVGALLIIARTEDVLLLSMRLFWLLWAAAFIAYAFLQVRLFRARHYTVLPTARVDDPRSKYLPKRKRR